MNTKLKWHRDGDDWVSGDWRIQRVFSTNPKGYGWYVTDPIDGGYYDSLAEAKADCQHAHDTATREEPRDNE